jgi:hypothetical protein
METLELPAVQELDKIPSVDFAENPIDLDAFQLWRDASQPELADVGEENS